LNGYQRRLPSKGNRHSKVFPNLSHTRWKAFTSCQACEQSRTARSATGSSLRITHTRVQVGNARQSKNDGHSACFNADKSTHLLSSKCRAIWAGGRVDRFAFSEKIINASIRLTVEVVQIAVHRPSSLSSYTVLALTRLIDFHPVRSKASYASCSQRRRARQAGNDESVYLLSGFLEQIA